MTFRYEIGDHISSLRDERGITQQKLADALHVSRETVNNWEHNRREIKGESAIDLANFFDVSCDKVLRGISGENLTAHEATGLSEKAIEKLKVWRSSEDPQHQDAVSTLNTLLESENVLHMLTRIGQYFKGDSMSVEIKANNYSVYPSEAAQLSLNKLSVNQDGQLGKGILDKHLLSMVGDCLAEARSEIDNSKTEKRRKKHAKHRQANDSE